MADGTKIAADIWLPAKHASKLPTVLRMVRYWRGTQYTDPKLRGADVNEQIDSALNDSGFAVVAIDARGTGASFGVSTGPWSPAELADDRAVVDWIIAQDWSNGAVVSLGVSYEANTAMMLSAAGHPAVKAVVPMFGDFDPYLSPAYPGGIFNRGFVQAWSKYTTALDDNDACALAQFANVTCDTYKASIVGPRPVDAALLSTALAEHKKNLALLPATIAATSRDDALGGGPSLEMLAPYSAAKAIDDANTPWLVRVSWMDADTATGALSAYQTLHNPQTLIIGTTSHAGLSDADPFQPVDAAPDPSITSQYIEAFTFLGQAIGGKPPKREIRYQTLGERTWRVTDIWPPKDATERSLYLADSKSLVDAAPAVGTASDDTLIDFAATTGVHNRWITPIDGSDIIYGDRAMEDQKLLTYTGAPLAEDLRVTGDPKVELFLSSSADGAVIVYLEDVAPDGKVTYVTEGELALAHRKEGPAPYIAPTPSHSFRHADKQPVVPGEAMHLTIHFAPTSVLFRKGHSLRIAVAGADADTFDVPHSPGLSFTIKREAASASRLILPVITSP